MVLVLRVSEVVVVVVVVSSKRKKKDSAEAMVEKGESFCQSSLDRHNFRLESETVAPWDHIGGDDDDGGDVAVVTMVVVAVVTRAAVVAPCRPATRDQDRP